MNNPLNNLNTVLIRMFAFNQDARMFFYNLLREYNRSHFPLVDLFSQIQKEKNPALKKIATMSIKSLRRNQEFAADYYRSGFFTENDTALLKLAENHDCIEEVTTLLLERTENRNPVLQILEGSFQWILLLIIMTAMTIYSMSFLEKFTDRFEWFFAYNRFIDNNYIFLAFTIAGIYIIYTILRKHLTGPSRSLLESLGAFHIYNTMNELQLLKLSKRLINIQLPGYEYLDILSKTFDHLPSVNYKIVKAKKKLQHSTLLIVLDNLFSQKNYSHIMASSPNHTPAEIAKGMDLAERMQLLKLDSTIKFNRMTLQIILAIASAVVTIPFVYISMGFDMNFNTPFN